MSIADGIINTTGSELPAEPEELDARQLRAIIKREARRLAVLATNATLTPSQVLAEISHTILPLLGDTVEIMDRLENHAEWASGEIERLGEDDESQLTAEDAARLMAYVEATIEFFQQSYDQMDPNRKLQAKEILQLADEGREGKKMIDEMTLEGDEPEPGEPEPGDGGDDGDDGD